MVRAWCERGVKQKRAGVYNASAAGDARRFRQSHPKRELSSLVVEERVELIVLSRA